jgi:uncharacterized membrane-anchored protein YitT (DUF2179 family)
MVYSLFCITIVGFVYMMIIHNKNMRAIEKVIKSHKEEIKRNRSQILNLQNIALNIKKDLKNGK